MNADEIRQKWKEQEEDLRAHLAPEAGANRAEILLFNSILINGWICSEICAQHAEQNSRNTEAEKRAQAAEDMLKEIQAHWLAFQQQSGLILPPDAVQVQVNPKRK